MARQTRQRGTGERGEASGAAGDTITPPLTDAATAFGVSEAEIRNVVARAASRKISLFAAFKEFDRDDLVQIGLMAVHEGWGKFRKGKGSWSTFVYRVAFCDIRDEYRARQRRGRIEGEVAVDRDVAAPADGADEAMDPPALTGTAADLAEWAQAVRLACVARFREAGEAKLVREGRRFYSPAQAVAAVLVMGRLKASARGMARACKASPALSRSMGFRHAPSADWFSGAWKIVPAKYRNFEGLRERWDKGQAETAAPREAA